MRLPILTSVLVASFVARSAKADPPATPVVADQAANPQPAPTVTTTEAPAQETAAKTASATITVHVDSPIPGDLEHRATPNSPWENVCIIADKTGCDTEVHAGEEYRVLGTNISPSKPFLFDTTKGNKLTIKIVQGSIRKSRTGLWLLGSSAALGVAGVVTLIASGVSNGFGADNVESTGRMTGISVGSLLIVAALGTGIAGTAYWLDNHESRADGPVVLPIVKTSEPTPAPRAAFMFPIVHLTF